MIKSNDICGDESCTNAACVEARAKQKEERVKQAEEEERLKNEMGDFRREKPIVLYRLYMYNPGTNSMFLLDFEYHILHTERDLRRNEYQWQKSTSPAGCILRPQRLEFYFNSIDDLMLKIPELEIRDYY